MRSLLDLIFPTPQSLYSNLGRIAYTNMPQVYSDSITTEYLSFPDGNKKFKLKFQNTDGVNVTKEFSSEEEMNKYFDENLEDEIQQKTEEYKKERQEAIQSAFDQVMGSIGVAANDNSQLEEETSSSSQDAPNVRNTPDVILAQAAKLYRKKSQDYRSKASGIKHSEFYPQGVKTIHDILHGKMLRAKSLIANIESNQPSPNFESLKDTFIDIINYAAFACSWLDGDLDGQTNKDPLNRS